MTRSLPYTVLRSPLTRQLMVGRVEATPIGRVRCRLGDAGEVVVPKADTHGRYPDEAHARRALDALREVDARHVPSVEAARDAFHRAESAWRGEFARTLRKVRP